MTRSADDAAAYVQLPIYTDQLAAALNFSPSDLEANRAGRLSDSQRSNQYRSIRRAVTLATVFALLTVPCVAASIAIGITSGLGLLTLLLGAAFALFVAVFVRYTTPLWRDVDAGLVSSIEGMVSQSEKETDIRTGPFTTVPIWAYYWTVDAADRFWVSGKAYAALTPARHRVYFLPQSRRIMAAEPAR